MERVVPGRTPEDEHGQRRLPDPPKLDSAPAQVLAMQRSVGNQAVARAVAESQDRIELSDLDEKFMKEDVEEIVAILKEQWISAGDEERILAKLRHWAELDRRHQVSGKSGTVNLDRILALLKMRVFSRRTGRSMWTAEQHNSAFDLLFDELEDDRLDEFKRIVARSEKQAQLKPSSKDGTENLFATIGKHEAMGVWGILKGMGLTLSGIGDAAVYAAWTSTGRPLGEVLEKHGWKEKDKAPALTPYLTKSYDEVAVLLGKTLNVDPTKDQTLLGQSSYEIGDMGGKVVGALTVAGATAGGAGEGAAGLLKVLGVVGAAKSIEESYDSIAKRVGELKKKQPPPSLAELLRDEAIMVDLASILGNALSAGSGLGEVSPMLKAAFERVGIVVDIAQLGPPIGKLIKDWNDPELAKDSEARDAALRDDIAGITGSVLSLIGTKVDEARDTRAKEAMEARNKAFDEQYNAESGKHVPDKPESGLADQLGEGYDIGALQESMPKTVSKLQEMALKTFTPDGPEAMVKVVPGHYTDADAVDGYVTKAKYVAGRTPEELATMLGAVKLEKGVKVYVVDVGEVPAEALGLRGYTNSPDGKDVSHHTEQALADYPPGSGAPQWKLLQKIPVARNLGVAMPGQPVKL